MSFHRASRSTIIKYFDLFYYKIRITNFFKKKKKYPFLYFQFFYMFNFFLQDLLHRRWHAVGKDPIMVLDFAHEYPTYAQTEAFMHFGINSIHLRRQMG
jgi:hypothetical protein